MARSRTHVAGQLLTLATGAFLAPYLHLARCRWAALCARPRDPSRRNHPGEGLIRYVIDFLQFRVLFPSPVFPGDYFPSFDLTDSVITLGVTCLILDEILRLHLEH